MSTLSFAKYGMFIYTQRPVIDAKNFFSYDFPIPFAQLDLLSKNLTKGKQHVYDVFKL